MEEMEVKCIDCNCNYGQQPLDVTLSAKQWAMINPEIGGILCAGCIVKRAAKLPHVITVAMKIAFAEDYAKFEGPLNPEEFISISPEMNRSRQPEANLEAFNAVVHNLKRMCQMYVKLDQEMRGAVAAERERCAKLETALKAASKVKANIPEDGSYSWKATAEGYRIAFSEVQGIICDAIRTSDTPVEPSPGPQVGGTIGLDGDTRKCCNVCSGDWPCREHPEPPAKAAAFECPQCGSGCYEGKPPAPAPPTPTQEDGKKSLP